MNHHHQVTIVGGGVIGLSIAWELARRGLGVTLLERDKVGQATSRAGAGILPPANFTGATDPIDRLRGLSDNLYPQWTAELESITGIDSGFRRCGGWYLADTPGERAAMIGMTDYWRELGIACDPATSAMIIEREPALAPWLESRPDAAAWWARDEAQIRGPRFLQALRQAARAANVEIVEQAPVTDIRTDGNRWQAAAGNHLFSSDALVICAGVWTGRIDPSLRLESSIVPIRGQILLLKTEQPLLGGIVNVGHRYIVCREDGHTLVGSCEEEAGFSLATTESMLASLHEFAVTLVPALADAERLDAWSGLRPMTFDGFPMIGPAPDQSGLYVAAGHFRSGLHLAPGTAVVMADLITGQSPPFDLEPFRVGKQQTQPWIAPYEFAR